mgnify:CR=1 FL=1
MTLEQQTKGTTSDSNEEAKTVRQISSLVAHFQHEAQNEKENRVQAQLQAQEKVRHLSIKEIRIEF